MINESFITDTAAAIIDEQYSDAWVEQLFQAYALERSRRIKSWSAN
jgi:hypothetical protein